MYLIVFTRRRLAPLVRKIPSLLPVAAICLLAGLVAALAWLQFETLGLRRQLVQLATLISGYEQQLAAERPANPAPDKAKTANILIDLRAPGGTDTLAAAVAGASAPDDGGVFAVQLASLHSLDEARRVADGLKANIPRPLLIQRAVLNSGQWYRVLIEPFPDRKPAAAFADSLRGGGAIRDYVLQRLPDGWRNDPDYSEVPN